MFFYQLSQQDQEVGVPGEADDAHGLREAGQRRPCGRDRVGHLQRPQERLRRRRQGQSFRLVGVQPSGKRLVSFLDGLVSVSGAVCRSLKMTL